MIKYFCKYCNYNTDIKCNYFKHLDTMKHFKNKKNNIQKNGSMDQKNGSMDQKNGSNVYLCKYCNKIFATSSHLNRHIQSCKIKKKIDIIQLRTQLQQKEDINNKQHQELQKKNNIIKEQQHELNEKKNTIEKLKIKVQLLSEIKDMCKKGKKSVMNIIINNYNNAPDFTAQPIYDMSDSDLRHYIDMGVPNGITEMMKDYYTENIPNDQRSLWCLDQARIKYLIRKDNDWKIDIMGKIIKKTILGPLQDKISDMIDNNKNELSSSEMLNYLENAYNLINKSKTNQILKSASGYFLLEEN